MADEQNKMVEYLRRCEEKLRNMSDEEFIKWHDDLTSRPGYNPEQYVLLEKLILASDDIT
jgi:hypothetical protein